VAAKEVASGSVNNNLVNTVAKTAGRVAARVVNAIESVTGAGRKRSR
jgi:DNA-binding transcriptional regulator YdaS (Cro superfamily)